MERIPRHTWTNRAVLLLLLSLFASCAKEGMDLNPRQSVEENAENLAIGTVRSQDGVRFIRIDETLCGQVVNPDALRDIPDGTRVFLEFRLVVSQAVPEFCTDAILVEWVSPLDVGKVCHDPLAFEGDPVSIITDWMTSLEDGFLTLHYTVPASGKMQHTFSICPLDPPYSYRLVHDAHADSGGKLTEGLVCFDVEGILPETGEDAVELSLEYMDLDHTKKQLTVDYRSPK